MKRAQPFKNFGSFDLGREFIHGQTLALDNGWLILPVSSIKNFFIWWEETAWKLKFRGRFWTFYI